MVKNVSTSNDTPLMRLTILQYLSHCSKPARGQMSILDKKSDQPGYCVRQQPLPLSDAAACRHSYGNVRDSTGRDRCWHTRVGFFASRRCIDSRGVSLGAAQGILSERYDLRLGVTRLKLSI